LITAFGELFTGIRINKQLSDETRDQVIEVPIGYGPKNKWLGLLNEDRDRANNVEMILPRLSYEITSYAYDPSRKVGPQGHNIVGTIGTNRAKVFNPVPYDITISLYSLAKTQDESLQILEQIVPYFAPFMIISLEMLPEFNIVKDIPITLTGVSVVDRYEGDMNDFRTVEQTFTFNAKIDMFGPINQNNKIIKETIVDITTTTNNTELPWRYDAVVNPKSANKNDDHTVDESWEYVEK
jgi:hypothetical protein